MFSSGREQDEIHALWEQFREVIPRRIGPFDEQWFASLLKERPAKAQPSTFPQVAQIANQESPPLRQPWSEIPDVPALYGRTSELTDLEQWLLVDRCRLVAVVGMGGIGKTSLVARLLYLIAPHFDCVLWCSLQNAPSLEDLLFDWLPVLEKQYEIGPSAQRIGSSLSLLFKLIQQRRCLLVLDNLETLFQEGTLEGYCRPGYEGYISLIKHVAEKAHQSCLLLTSREQFTELEILAGRQAPVRILRLGSLPLPASQQLLHDKSLSGSEEIWKELVNRYTGNPLALKIVAETIHELFGGDIAAFLAEGVMTFRGIRQLLSQQFERLSSLEQTLMYWLAIERELTSLEVLRAALSQPVTKREVIEAIQSLHSRSLVERGEQGAAFTLQPVVLEYVTERLVMLMSEEISQGQPVLLLTHAFLQGQAKDYIRTSQARLMVRPVLDRLLAHFGTAPALEAHLEGLLQHLRGLPHARQGYGGGNIVNVLIGLNGHVKGKDCSHLTIWQANLQGVQAQGANFAESDLTGSTWTETTDGIMSVAFSPDGQYVAAGSITGEVRLWRVTDSQPLLTFQAHSRLSYSLAFNSESTQLISGGYDGLVKILEISSGTCLRILQGHNKWIGLIALHPAGRLLATCSDDQSIRLWDLETGECLRVWNEQKEVWSVAWSPDGRLLASSYADGTIKLWDYAREACTWSVVAHRGLAVSSLAFSPDGELLVSAGEDATIMVWQTRNGKFLLAISGHTDVVQFVTFNERGILASSSFDHTVKLWKITQVGQTETTAQCLVTLHGHTNWVWSTAFGPGGLLVSGDQDGVLKLWQISQEGDGGKCLRTLRSYSRLVNSVALSPDGNFLLSDECSGTVRLWETKSGQCLHVFSKQASEFSAIVFSPDGRLFTQGLPDRTLKVWDVRSGQCMRTLRGHQREICSAIFSVDGRFLISGSVDTTIRLWEVESGRCLKILEGHNIWVWALACSRDGRFLASGDTQGVAKLWELDSGKVLHTLQSGSRAILALTFTSDGSKLLSSNTQGLVTTWDVQSGHCLKSGPGVEEIYWLGAVALSDDGNLLATVGSGQTVKLWDVESGSLLRAFSCRAGQPWSVALSADQRLLACGTHDGTILLWERDTGKCLLTLRSDRPYERMNISGVTGITEAQKASLLALGAVEESGSDAGAERPVRP